MIPEPGARLVGSAGESSRGAGASLGTMPRLHTSLYLPRPVPQVFAFFADAGNLQQITPAWVDFTIVTPLPIDMRPGTLIDYRLKVHGVPVRWRTEISAWQPPRMFIDTQLTGPYWRWVHTHRFREAPGGTLVEDDVDYAVPGGWPVDRLFVRRDLRAIFLHRQRAILDVFGATPREPLAVRFA